MKIFEKKVHYFKFFEDVKLTQHDHDYNRLAIVFFGKENLIHIFDSDPYQNYFPIEEDDRVGKDKFQKKNKSNPDKKKNSPFVKDQNLQELFSHMKINRDNHEENLGKTIYTQNQEFIMYNSIIEEEKTKFTTESFTLESTHPRREVKLSLFKPKVKTKILSVIQSCSDVLGLKWFTIPQSSLTNGQETSKLLLSVHEDGYISIFGLKSFDYESSTIVNTSFLQMIPFENFPESWTTLTKLFTGIPIKDFYMSETPNRLYTLHIDNYVLSWVVSFRSRSLTIIPNYGINISPNLVINRILVERQDQFIYTFHSDCMKIFKIMDKPPFPLVYIKPYCKLDYKQENKKKSIPKCDYLKKEDLESEEDLVDFDENYEIQERNYLSNLQKPEFSPLGQSIFFTILDDKNNFVLLCFDNEKFLSKIRSDFDFVKKCCQGEDKTLLYPVHDSLDPISFAFAPSLYLSSNLQSLEEEVNTGSLNQETSPVVFIINENMIQFYRNRQVLYKTFLSESVSIDHPELRIVSWIANNTILINSTKVFLHMIKFCNEFNTLGIPICPKKFSKMI